MKIKDGFDLYSIAMRRAGNTGNRRLDINLNNLGRIGFVEVLPSRVTLTREFINYVLDPVGFLKESPDLFPTLLPMDHLERAFFSVARREIFERLGHLITNELSSESSFSKEQRSAALCSDLKARPWLEKPWKDIASAADLYKASSKLASGQVIDVPNLAQQGLIDRASQRDLLKRITPRFIYLVYDPSYLLKTDPSFNPYRTIMGAQERQLFEQIINDLIEAAQTFILPAESSLSCIFTSAQRVQLIHDILQK